MNNEFQTIAEAVKHLNGLRLKNKNNWVFYQGNLNGKSFGVKFFGTWTQVFKCESFKDSGLNGLNVTEWKNEIKTFLEGL